MQLNVIDVFCSRQKLKLRNTISSVGKKNWARSRYYILTTITVARWTFIYSLNKMNSLFWRIDYNSKIYVNYKMTFREITTNTNRMINKSLSRTVSGEYCLNVLNNNHRPPHPTKNKCGHVQMPRIVPALVGRYLSAL